MPDHASDPQAEAFHAAHPDDLAGDELLAEMLRDGLLVDTTDEPIVPVESHEAAHWDRERQGPKSVEQARDALASRVADPAAPDGDATAYDDLLGA